MRTRNQQFGMITVAGDTVVRLVGGLVGFEDHEEFMLCRSEEFGPFAWLVSTRDQALQFAVADPDLFVVVPYQLNLGEVEQSLLDLQKDDLLDIFLIVSPSMIGEGVTANLKGPIVFNRRTQTGKQLLLYSSRYSTRQPMKRIGQDVIDPESDSSLVEVRFVGRKAA